MEYRCPAQLTPAELKALERTARETFSALDCRDVARIVVRMNTQGLIYVLEVNPLPGLTPDYSDLVLIGKAAGIDFKSLIGEILAGGLKRMREKRRSEQAPKEKAQDKAQEEKAEKAAEKPNGSQLTPPNG